jgi:hypothetical protein
MALVTTVPFEGGEAKVYDIPDGDLAKYEAVEAKNEPYDQAKDTVSGGTQMAGGIDLDKEDVQAYGRICICYFWWGGRLYYRYQYCWQHCP